MGFREVACHVELRSAAIVEHGHVEDAGPDRKKWCDAAAEGRPARAVPLGDAVGSDTTCTPELSAHVERRSAAIVEDDERVYAATRTRLPAEGGQPARITGGSLGEPERTDALEPRCREANGRAGQQALAAAAHGRDLDAVRLERHP